MPPKIWIANDYQLETFRASIGWEWLRGLPGFLWISKMAVDKHTQTKTNLEPLKIDDLPPGKLT